VLTDLFGVSGQAMFEALLEGTRGPESIAEFARERLERKAPDIIAALQGHQMSDHHRFLIRQALRHMEFLETGVVAAWWVLKSGLSYRELGPTYLDEKRRNQLIRHHTRRLKELSATPPINCAHSHPARHIG
jgi:hypothetical protein